MIDLRQQLRVWGLVDAAFHACKDIGLEHRRASRRHVLAATAVAFLSADNSAAHPHVFVDAEVAFTIESQLVGLTSGSVRIKTLVEVIDQY